MKQQKKYWEKLILLDTPWATAPIKLVDIVTFSFFLNIFLTAGRSIRHSGGCEGERVKDHLNN